MEALDVPRLTFVFAIACDAAGRGTYVADTDVRPLPPGSRTAYQITAY